MSLSAEKVVAASNAWTWIPDNATTEATEEYLLVRFPDYFDHPLELLRFSPAEAVRGCPARRWTRCSTGRAGSASPTCTGGSGWTARPRSRTCSWRAARRCDETLDVLAVDLSRGRARARCRRPGR